MIIGLLDLFSTVRGWMYISPFILLAMLWSSKVRWSKYPMEAVIIEKRGDNLIKTNDRVGKFYDRHSDMTFYRLKKSKDTIPVYDYDWILHNKPVNTNILEKLINILQGNSGTIFLLRYGSKQYKPLTVEPAEEAGKVKVEWQEVKNKKNESVFVQQYINFDPRLMLGVLNIEVIDWDNMNFIVQEQRASIARRAARGDWMKTHVVPIFIIAASLMFALLVMKFSYDAGADLRAAAGKVPQEENGGSIVGNAVGGIVTPGQ